MTGSRAGELVLAALVYAIDCLAEGDRAGLADIGLGEDEAAMLRGLTLEDLREVGRLCVHGLDVRFDRNVFGVVMAHLRSTREAEMLQEALIAADAPRAMMQELFGMSAREYARRRARSDVTSGVGRPADLDEATEHRLWHALDARLRSDPDRPLPAAQYLEVQAETGAPLRAVWNGARQWKARHGGESKPR